MTKYPLRSYLVASPGRELLAFDLSAAEAWVVAFLANCQQMKDTLLTGGDLHSLTAKFIFEKDEITKEERYIGKKLNHSCNYGTTPFKIVESINAEGLITVTLAECKVFHSKWTQLYWEIPTWWREIQNTLEFNRRTLRTPYGREREFTGFWGDDLFKEAYAYIPQSTVGDHMLGATQAHEGAPAGGIREIYKQLIIPNKDKVSIVNTAHDSVVLDCDVSLSDAMIEGVKRLLKRPIRLDSGEEFTIPVDAERGERYGELVKVA